MSIARDIIIGKMPDFDLHLRLGESLDDIDEYGFTPLIECAIANQVKIAQKLLERSVDVNKPDVTGRTPLHWAVDNNNLSLIRLLLKYGANPNAYTNYGLSILVYPLLRRENAIKNLLYQYGAKPNFALDFINFKLLGHRFELKGDMDFMNAEGEFIELDYEGFFLEFTLAIVKDSVLRFVSSYSTRNLRHYFSFLKLIINSLSVAESLLKLQQYDQMLPAQQKNLVTLLKSPMLILPAASRGHALCFIRYKQWWAKIDRGENSVKEGSVNIYLMRAAQNINVNFMHDFLYKKQPREYFHDIVPQILNLIPVLKLPIPPQITGNCSWANVQAIIPVAYALQQLDTIALEDFNSEEAVKLYDLWLEWDKDRALDECIQRFYMADNVRRASFAAILGAILFQACDASNPKDLQRAEKILTILTKPDYYYILASYLDIYCVKRLTSRGNNLLKILDDCGVNPNIDVNFIATGLKKFDK